MKLFYIHYRLKGEDVEDYILGNTTVDAVRKLTERLQVNKRPIKFDIVTIRLARPILNKERKRR